MAYQLERQDNLVVQRCPTCGIVYAIPQSHIDFTKAKKSDGEHRTTYCPAGHPWYYSSAEAEVDRLRSEIDSLTKSLEWEKGARQRADRHEATLRGQITKLKGRGQK